jgi:hypothetical protein
VIILGLAVMISDLAFGELATSLIFIMRHDRADR